MTIAICDDEAPVRRLIKSYILKQSEGETILEFASGEALLSSLRASGEDVDILFLDISFGSSTHRELVRGVGTAPATGLRRDRREASDRGGEGRTAGDKAGKQTDSERATDHNADGMEIAAQIRAMYEGQSLVEGAALPVIIFVTGDEKRMPEAFHVHAFQYIVKPVDETVFREIFAKARQEVLAIRETKKSKSKKLIVQQNGMSVSVDIRDILFAESIERKVVLHLPNETVEYYGKISDAEGTLGSRFFRVHRGFLVNLDAVKKYARNQIEVRNGETVPMSRFKYQPFVEAYMRHIT